MWVSVLWVAGGIIFNIFEAAPMCLDIPLSILVRRPHKKLCPQKNCETGREDEEPSELGVKLQSRERDF